MDHQAYVKESLNAITREINKDSRSVKNRIHSIYADAAFVQRVADAFELPLVANERCGRWYIPPSEIEESVYFKSTDGHVNQWSFSTRRLNTHIIPVIKKHGGLVIVDSTRRGKRIPDALSKTIPIWCSVLNKVLFGIDTFETSRSVVSRSEHSQIVARLSDFEASLKALDVEISLDMPLKPIWITPQSKLPDNAPLYEDFYPIVLCTASEMVQDGTDHRLHFTYVQGAADDHEEWAKRLTPEILWAEIDFFMNAETDQEIHDAIDKYAAKRNAEEVKEGDMTEIKPHSIWVGTTAASAQDFDILINLCAAAKPEDGDLVVPLKPGKVGAKDLRLKLPSIVNKVSRDKSIGIICDTGTDFSIGAALTIICKLNDIPATKANIRKQLAHIITQHKCNPSRASLNAVNSYLMG